jgi:acyl-CoA reductase-like NAD-dependent aldehyde dehydrogenase
VGVTAFADAAGARSAITVAVGGAYRWAETSVEERAAVLGRAAALLISRGHEFAAWLVHEGGRDRAAAWAEVVEAVDFLGYYALRAKDLFGTFGDRIAPRGVVAVISPWNFPLAIPCGMTAAALAGGNAVVLKPAEQTPLIGQRLVALLHEAGVPRDALIALPGRGETAGAALVGSPEVAMVAFTGSRAVGTLMHEAVAEIDPTGDAVTKTLVAEMGGKNPVVVFADADLDEVVDGVLRSAFGHANQKCSAASRILIEAPIYERVRDRLIEAARSLRVGPADAPDTQVNPVIDREAYQRLRRDADTARTECDVLLDDFEQPTTDGESLMLGPLVVELSAARASTARTTTEELFGPIIVLVPFTTEEEAFRLANATAYGLTAGVFSRSPATVERATESIAAGNLYVNRTTTGARVGVEPFGGMKMSGTGPKAGGLDYLWAFVRRTDLPADDPEMHVEIDAAEGSPVVLPEGRWDAPLTARIEAVEHAAVLLASRGRGKPASGLLTVAQAARREIGQAQPTVPVAGQHTRLSYDTARGLGVLCAAGEHAEWWLAAPLLAGNSLMLFDSSPLEELVGALHEAGVPADVLGVSAGGREAMLELARRPEVAFAASDGGPALACALHRVVGPTDPRQRSLKALISRLDGPQATEPGFVRRFAWPKLVAVHTLRHGADLGLDVLRDATSGRD